MPWTAGGLPVVIDMLFGHVKLGTSPSATAANPVFMNRATFGTTPSRTPRSKYAGSPPSMQTTTTARLGQRYVTPFSETAGVSIRERIAHSAPGRCRVASRHHPPAARMEHLAGEVPALLRGEEHDAVRDVLDGAEAADRQLLDPARAVLRRHDGAAHVGVDPARRDRVDRDPVLAHLVGERAREALDGALGGGVGGEAARADARARELRAEIDDPAVAPLDHGRQRVAGAEERPGHVDREHLVVAAHGHLVEHAPLHHAGVVDEDV